MVERKMGESPNDLVIITGMSGAGSVFNSIRNRLGGNSGGTGSTGGGSNSN